MTGLRLTHAQREGIVVQELQASLSGFAGVPAWTSLPDDPPDFTGASSGGLVGLELIEWLDGARHNRTPSGRRHPG